MAPRVRQLVCAVGLDLYSIGGHLSSQNSLYSFNPKLKHCCPKTNSLSSVSNGYLRSCVALSSVLLDGKAKERFVVHNRSLLSAGYLPITANRTCWSRNCCPNHDGVSPLLAFWEDLSFFTKISHSLRRSLILYEDHDSNTLKHLDQRGRASFRCRRLNFFSSDCSSQVVPHPRNTLFPVLNRFADLVWVFE